MIIDVSDDDFLAHYGVLRKSGRYPWGSTDNVPGSKEVIGKLGGSFADAIDELKARGVKEADIAKGFGISIAKMRAARSYEANAKKMSDIAMAERLSAKGYGATAGAKRMGLSGESAFRALLDPGAKERAQILTTVAETLKRQVDEKSLVDVGTGVEASMGITRNKLDTALHFLEEQGYVVHPFKSAQLGTGEKTTFKVLAPPGTTQKEVFLRRNEVRQIDEHSDDGGRTMLGIHPPIAVNPKRIQVRYKEDGGDKFDGMILVRPNVKDLSLGESRYAQVRVAVGKNHYLKGMAMHSNDIPDGVDIVFNTNKSRNDPKIKTDLDAMKAVNRNADGTINTDNPFGANISRQIIEKSKRTGEEKVTSAMNIVNEEGKWSTWSRSLSSQFLSKQEPRLARAQLNMTVEKKQKDLAEINALTNPTVKKKLLEAFADSADSSAVHLEAATLSRNSSHHVILPIESMPETQIYAPNFQNGQTVALVRHPHGGTFEIPFLTVNNNQKEAKSLLGNAQDAVGIHHSVAERLSGADFDGDTVIVMPSEKVKSTPALEGLKDFDPRSSYPGYDGMGKIHTQTEMGKISNLITDMTIKRASTDELARAVRHSMVVIDAEKHNLNWKESAKANGISALKTKYQGDTPEDKKTGASTLISRAGARIYIPDRRAARVSEGGSIDPLTGEKRYTDTGKTHTNRDGVAIPSMHRSKKLAETTNAHTLVSGPPGSPGTPIERVYADHSNRLKGLANEARLSALHTPNLERNPSAAKTYAPQIDSLNAKLDLIKRNRPKERAAQLVGTSIYVTQLQANPNMDDASKKKVKYQALTEARHRVGSKHHSVVIEHDEWDAIQAGAISNSMLKDILAKADMDVVRQLATPHTQYVVTPAKLTRIHQMMAQGYTRAEIGKQLGIALGTLDDALYGKE